jgi:sporulation protein YqfC
VARRRRSRQNGPIVIEKKQKSTLLQKVARVMELPMDLVSGMSHIELSGNREAVIDGCSGVLEFDENIVRLTVGKFIVKFTGRGLVIKELTKSSVVVEGFIISIEYMNV